jgi:uncharacterized membrane protein
MVAKHVPENGAVVIWEHALLLADMTRQWLAAQVADPIFPPVQHACGSIRLELKSHDCFDEQATRRFLCVIAMLMMAPSAICALSGMWASFPFPLLEFALFAYLIRSNSRDAEAGQVIQLDASRITITSTQPGASKVEMDRYWSRVRLADGAVVLIESKGRHVEVGSFLPEPARRELAARLGQLIGRVGELPVLAGSRPLRLSAASSARG